jgi:CheY-like chemotaxis protein
MSVNRSRHLVEEAEEGRAPAVSVLVVDDQAAIRESMVITFRREGYAVESSESGEEALDLLYRKPFDLVVTDPGSPASAGSRCCARRRRSFPRPKWW